MSKFSPDYLARLFAHQVRKNHRSVFVLIGEGSKQQIPQLHEMLCTVSQLNNIVWCYKNSQTYVEREMKKMRPSESDSEFIKWVKTQDPEYISYKENAKILGRTCDMLVLQDFEAITPNILASSVETVRGGGAVVLLFDREKSIGDVISRKSDMVVESIGEESVQRFNRRLFKSLTKQFFTVFLDSKLRIMDVTAHLETADDTTIQVIKREKSGSEDPLMQMCRTDDQAFVLQRLFEALGKNDETTVSILAARGRGKSVALGLAISKAIAMNISPILVSSLFLENVQSIFEFLVCGLEAQGYRKMADYKVVYSFQGKKRLICKVEVIRGGKRSVEYADALCELKLSPNLLVIDEAAAIPQPQLKKLLRSRLVFMATTVGGYEGTGRTFKIRMNELVQGNVLEMAEPIRYSLGDPVEKWLYDVLLLETRTCQLQQFPLPAECSLYCVNKDALFSGHPKAEEFLSEIFSLFIASHYRNSPNDMQILSDSKNHQLFTFMAVSRVICAIQVSFEGKCNRNSLTKEGNLIPWVLFDNFRDEALLQLFGARIVRIAVHPSAMSMGYGTAALLGLAGLLESATGASPSLVFEDRSLIFHNAEKVALPQVDWIGSSFGVTERLLNFWKRLLFVPVCIKQQPSRSTGEFSIGVVKFIDANKPLFTHMKQQFLQRFIPLLSFGFSEMPPTLALSLIYSSDATAREKSIRFTQDEADRLKLFSKGLIDMRSVLDILPDLSRLYFSTKDINRMGVVSQTALLMIGCQRKGIEAVCDYLDLEYFKVVNLVVQAVDLIVSAEYFIIG